MPPEPQIITVLGERVSLEPTPFPSSEKFLVSFDEKYRYSDITDTEVQLLKRLLHTLFSEKNQPNPPCSDKEKDILMKSLHHRFGLLRNELISERKHQSDSLRLRQILDQFERFKQYIDFAQSTKECKEMDEDILAESLGDLTEDQILQLLRQFVFFILQGQHPLKEFTGRDPNPRGFVARLDRSPLPNFQEFLDKYRDKKYPVPLRIEQVLEATKLDLDAMKKSADAALSEKIQKIILLLKGVIPESDPFWESPLWNAEIPDIVAIVDELLSVIKALVEELDACQANLETMQRDIHGLEEARERKTKEETILRGQLAILEKEVDRLQASRLGQEEKESLKANIQSRIQTLEKQLASSQAQSNRLADELLSKEQELQDQQALITQKEAELVRLRETQGELDRLRAANASLEEQLRTAQQKAAKCDEVQTRVRALEAEVKGREEQLVQLRLHAGQLTLDIDAHLQDKLRLQGDIRKLQEQLSLFNELEEDVKELSRRLDANKEILLPILETVQRKRSDLHKEDDHVLAKLLAVRETLQASNGRNPSLSSQVADILKDVQQEVSEEVSELETQKKDLEDKVAEKDAEIEATQRRMEEGNRLLSLVRAGRDDLERKGIKFETDRDLIGAAFKAVEAERELQAKKTELETEVNTLTSQNQALQANMEALTVKLARELESVKEQLQATGQKLQIEEDKVSSLEEQFATNHLEFENLQQSLQREQEKTKVAEAALETQRIEAQQKIIALEETKIRECEERLVALREEETKKREALLTSQGGEKGDLEAHIAELLRQVTTVEGERDGAKQEVVALNDRIQQLTAELEKQKQESQETVIELERQFKESKTESATATGQVTKLTGTVSSLEKEIEDLRSQIVADSTERAKIFELVSQLSVWISSGAKLPQPVIDQHISTKYGFNRILDAFLSYLPPPSDESGIDPMNLAMTRCQLVFFMTYVYARHFPKKTDENSSHQSTIMAFLRDVQTGIYRALDVGIPGKLESVGAGGIPIQLKSKYMMNLLMPLLKQMELVHESGKKDATFLKVNLLDRDQLDTFHKLHNVLLDKLLLPKNREFHKTLNHYVIRKTGNMDDDIHELYLRFFHESKGNLEFPVLMYAKSDAHTFGTEEDFTKYLSSPSKKSDTSMEKSLVSKPVFSFNILFYLFLFFVKDYLSSIEGELDKVGCPLPQALKPL